jgi:N6-adenosine-specific RNA methylase IME4
MIIDPEFKALIPALAPEEISQLEANILAEGCRDPLVTWQGILIDGHNRFAICSKLGLAFQTLEREFTDRSQVVEWIIRNQFGRRNLSAYERTKLALRLEETIAARAKANQVESGKEFGKGCQISDKPIDPIDTKRELAQVAGVSHDTVAKVKKIESKAAPEVKAALSTGAISINQAYQQIKREEKEAIREERREENRVKVAQATTPESIIETGARFSTIMIDPPWDWGDEGDHDQLGRARPDYATMSREQLLELPLPDLSDADCHLYLWITNRSLPKGFELIERWGFRYVTMITWAKPHFGMGNYFRGQTEQILFAVKGSQPLKRKDVGTLFSAPRGPNGHSSKPPEFYSLVESCSPGPYLEMFSRSNRDGWKTWGENA